MDKYYIREMLLELIDEIDFNPQQYNNSEFPEEFELKLDKLTNIVERHLKNSEPIPDSRDW